MERVYDSCCGIDVHKKLIVACFRQGRKEKIRKFGVFNRVCQIFCINAPFWPTSERTYTVYLTISIIRDERETDFTG